MRSVCCNSKQFYNYQDQVLCTNKRCGNYLCGTEVNVNDVIIGKRLFFFLVFTASIFYSPRNYCSSPLRLQLGEVRQETVVPEKPLTMENLEEEVRSLGMICPEVVVAQVKLESGHLTSHLLKRTNNMFGMRYPNKRKTTAIGIYIPSLDSLVIGSRQEIRKYAEYSSYAVYSRWQDAVADYKLWQENAFKVNEKYIDFLQRNYAEDSTYVQRVQYLARKK
jgi:hypothetical protein